MRDRSDCESVDFIEERKQWLDLLGVLEVLGRAGSRIKPARFRLPPQPSPKAILSGGEVEAGTNNFESRPLAAASTLSIHFLSVTHTGFYMVRGVFML